MRQLLRNWGLAALLVLAGGLALADEITLDNGKTLRGKVVRRQGGQAVIQLDNGGRISIAESRIARIESGAAAQPPSGAVTGGEPGSEPAGEKGAEPPAEQKAPGTPAEAKPDPKVLARVTALVEAMGARDEEENSREAADAARTELVRIGEPALDALCKALQDLNGYRRLNAAKALGEIGSKKSVVPLLAALYTGTPQGQKVVWWDRAYLRACASSFTKITGASFSYDSNSVLAGAEVEKMLAWWKDNAKDYPPQTGAAPAKAGTEGQETPPDPTEEIRKLPPRKFPAPASDLHER